MKPEILRLEIHDWNEEIEDQRIFDLHKECIEGKLDRVFFNYSVTNIDMSLVVCITTTREDLEEHDLGFLLSTQALSPNLCTPNCWRKYDPETWKDPEKNGQYFEYDSYFRNKLWLCVDTRGNEYPTNMYPHHMDSWKRSDPDKIKEYYKIHSWKPDFFNDFEGEDRIPVFRRFVFLPTGFIETYLGRKMTYQDEPIMYETFKFEDLDLWKE